MTVCAGLPAELSVVERPARVIRSARLPNLGDSVTVNGKRGIPPETTSFADACELLEGVLRGPLRRDFVAVAMNARDYAASLARLRSAMRSHTFATRAGWRAT